MRRFGMFVFLFALLIPVSAHANGVVPILNFFHPEMWASVAVATLVIVLVESAILRWRIRDVRFAGTLWRSLILNGASSLAGSVVLLTMNQDAYFAWDMPSLLLPLFVITLLVEIPLLGLLFNRYTVSWERAALLGLGINITSYAVVLMLQLGLLFGWLAFAGQRDERELAAWDNPDITMDAPGLIYAVSAKGYGLASLSVYDPRAGEWSALDNAPAIDPFVWDVEGRVCAFIQRDEETHETGDIVVARLPQFETLLGINPINLRESGPGHEFLQRVSALAISPDQQKLAVLMRVASAAAPRNDSSYFALGGKCRLVIVELESGQELTRATRWASDFGLCWHADSSRILFTSYDDVSLYDNTESAAQGRTSYGIGHARDDRFSYGIYEFDIASESIKRFSDGARPALAIESGNILVKDGRRAVLFDSSGLQLAQFEIPRLGHGQFALSPDGKLILAEIGRHVPFYSHGRLVVLRAGEPTDRHIIRAHAGFRFDWTVRVD